MSSQFSELQQQFFRKIFDMYDRDKIGRAQTEDIPTMVRVCGAIPMEADLEMLKTIADKEGRGSCNFEGMCVALKVAFDSSVSPDDAREAFAGFNIDGRGIVSQHALRFFLTTMGDALSAEEMNTFMEELQSEMDMEGNLVGIDAIEKMTPEFRR